MGFFTKFINRRNDKEANHYRLVKQRDSGEISYFFEDSKSESFITVDINKDGSKSYERVDNLTDQENFDANWESYTEVYSNNEEEKNCIDFYEENKMTRQDKINRLNEVRTKGSFNKRFPEKKLDRVMSKETSDKIKMQKEINKIVDNYFNI